jgi:hypothetical protein
MTLVLNSNLFASFCEKDRLYFGPFRQNLQTKFTIRPENIKKDLKTKLKLSDTEILNQYLSNSYTDFNLEYNSDTENFLNKHKFVLHKKFTHTDSYDFFQFSEKINNSFLTKLMRSNILNNHIHNIINEFQTCFTKKINNNIFYQIQRNFPKSLFDKIKVGVFPDNSFCVFFPDINIIISSNYVIVTLSDNLLGKFSSVITEEYIRVQVDDNVCLMKLAANIFFIILYNLYDLLWSTSRP